MKGINENKIEAKEREDALLNFVNYKAQEAILNPNLPDSHKDLVVEAAVETLERIAVRKAVYYIKQGERGRTRKPTVIYEASDYENKERRNTPSTIEEINASLRKPIFEDLDIPTVENIAERLGVNEKILYEWVKTDSEFSEALERLKKVQEDDPFKTGTEEDSYVSAIMITFLLLETKDRHDKLGNS